MGEQFNNPEENLEFLRGEMVAIKEKVEKECEKDNVEIEDEEALLYVEPEKLTDNDLRLFQTLKEVQNGEKSFTEAWKSFERHKLDMAEHISDMSENDPAFNFRKDSKVAFFDWLSDKLLDNYGKK